MVESVPHFAGKRESNLIVAVQATKRVGCVIGRPVEQKN